MIARCYRDLGDEPRFVHQALHAFQERPSRAEPLHMLATYYRERGRSDLVMLMAEAGRKIPFPKDRLFVEDHVYEHGFAYETSISGFYVADETVRARAYRECMRLAIDRRAPGYIQHGARRNSRLYARSAAECFGASTPCASMSRARRDIPTTRS